MNSLIVYCADVGSVERGRFGWARVAAETPEASRGSREIEELVSALVGDLRAGLPVALGFECPLYVPLPADPKRLAKARDVDGNRPWSAGAGCGALATGLTQVAWVLSQVRNGITAEVPSFLDWGAFLESGSGLFLWEAFVTGKAKPNDDAAADDQHIADAIAGARYFLERVEATAVQGGQSADEVYSLIGAALLRSGWSSDLDLLRTPCVVARVPVPVAST